MKMILIVLLATLISLATSQIGTPECTAAALALAAQADCQLAVDSITFANFTQDQFDLVCNDTLECNRLYRSVVQSCSPVSFPASNFRISACALDMHIIVVCTDFISLHGGILFTGINFKHMHYPAVYYNL